jgi:hypothetical protein
MLRGERATHYSGEIETDKWQEGRRHWRKFNPDAPPDWLVLRKFVNWHKNASLVGELRQRYVYSTTNWEPPSEAPQPPGIPLQLQPNNGFPLQTYFFVPWEAPNCTLMGFVKPERGGAGGERSSL